MSHAENLENLRAFIVIVFLIVVVGAFNFVQSEYLANVIKTENWKLTNVIKTEHRKMCRNIKLINKKVECNENSN